MSIHTMAVTNRPTSSPAMNRNSPTTYLTTLFTLAPCPLTGFSNRDASWFQFPTKGRRDGFPDAPNAGLGFPRILRSLHRHNRGIRPRGRAEVLDVLLQ